VNGKILLIVIDQFRADCLSGALADAANLPNLRRLMRESVTFNRHYTVTTPCGPSRASLLTGMYAMNHRSIRNGTPLERHHATIGTEFRKAGYEPMLFGYTDVSADPLNRHPNDPDLKSYEGLAPGFAEIVRMRLESNTSWIGHLKSRGYDVPDDHADIFKPGAGGNQSPITGPALYSAEDSDTAFLTDRTLEELSAREHHDWFSMVTYIRPHPPLVAPAPYNTIITPSNVPEPVRPNTLSDHRKAHPYFEAGFHHPSNRHLYIGFDGHLDRIPETDIAALRAVYLGLAMEVDHHIGRLLDYLRHSGQYDDTLIVVTADHGEMLGDHYSWGKDSPFEGALHIPLVIRDPRNRKSAGRQVDAFTESVDIAPTLLDWVGEKPALGFNGVSLLPFVEGKTPDRWRDHVFAELDFGDPIEPTRHQTALGLPAAQANYAVLRDDRFKYVHFNGGLPPLLYDMKADPAEGNNLAADPSHAADLLRFTNRMLDHRMTFAHHTASRMKISQKGLLTG
jgi:arylsulfatase A-like enzyme